MAGDDTAYLESLGVRYDLEAKPATKRLVARQRLFTEKRVPAIRN
jgi:hypothetical protein